MTILVRQELPTVRTLARPHSHGYEPAGDLIWVSKFGTALSAVAIHRQASVLTAANFGAPITLHRLRTIAANNPG